jgi:hypothetical protein
MRTGIVLFALVTSAAVPAAAQAQPPRPLPFAPKKGDSVAVKGCLRGSALAATEVGSAEGPSRMSEPLTFRLTGDKAALKSLRADHDGRIVEVRGVLKSDLPNETGHSRQLGRVRIAIGAPAPNPNSPEAAARRPQPVLQVKTFTGLGTICGR